MKRFAKLQLKDTPSCAGIFQLNLWRIFGVSSSCNLQRFCGESLVYLWCIFGATRESQKIRQRYAKLQLKDTPRYTKDTPIFSKFFF
jgi:hypothetical protein